MQEPNGPGEGSGTLRKIALWLESSATTSVAAGKGQSVTTLEVEAPRLLEAAA